jgi:ParB family chromosome partitioning protein
LAQKVAVSPQVGGNICLIPSITKRDYWSLNLVDHTQWANRNELSFSGSDWNDFKEEISNSGGNVQPIKVRRVAPGGASAFDYEIVFGHRRHRACLELDLPVFSLVEEISDLDLFVQMDRENRQRSDLRPFEQGLMYARALDEKLYSSAKKCPRDWALILRILVRRFH